MNTRPHTPTKEELRAEEASVRLEAIVANAKSSATELILKGYSAAEALLYCETMIATVIVASSSGQSISERAEIVRRHVIEQSKSIQDYMLRVAKKLGIEVKEHRL